MSFYITVTISSVLAFVFGWLATYLVAEIWRQATRQRVNMIRDSLSILRIDMTYFDIFLFFYGLAFLAIFLIFGVYYQLWAITIGLCFLLWDIPKSYVKKLLTKKKHLLEEQLTQTISVVCNSLRAGLSLENCFQEALQASSNPMKYELEKIVYENAHGSPFQEVFHRSKNRLHSIPSYVLFITAVVTSKKRGGNLTQVLERLKSSILVTHELERSLATATASGNFQIKIMLYFLPIFGLAVSFLFSDCNFSAFLDNLQNIVHQILQLTAYVIVYVGYRIGKYIITPKF